MAIRDFLLPLVSYPRPVTEAAIEAVVALCAGLVRDGEGAAVKTRLSALVYEIEIESGLYFEGAHAGEFLASQAKKSAANAQQLVGWFEAAVSRHAVLHRCSLERGTFYQVRGKLIEAARLHHLTVLPLRRDDEDQFDGVEGVIFESGRPVLVFPQTPGRRLATSFDHIAIAWDASRPATRAVSDAMPFLRQAKSVRVFTATDDKPLSSAQSQQFIAHLAGLGVNAVHEDVRKTDSHSIGSFMEAYVASRQIDLLVMGAYGHSRFREFILGGATRSILTNPPGWVLLSH
jgi:nucleotide-binding universal stress UspA family protein